jgi:hypothetical protein
VSPELFKTLNFLLTWLMMMAPMIKWWAKNVFAK